MRRAELYTAMHDHLTSVLDEHNAVLRRLKSDSDIDENEANDMEDYSHQSEANDMEIRTKVQISQVQQEIDDLKKLKGIVSDGEVKDGSFVVTKDRIFFIGVSSSNVEISGKKMLGISHESPAYKSLIGKKTKDSIQLENLKVKIEEIY